MNVWSINNIENIGGDIHEKINNFYCFRSGFINLLVI